MFGTVSKLLSMHSPRSVIHVESALPLYMQQHDAKDARFGFAAESADPLRMRKDTRSSALVTSKEG